MILTFEYRLIPTRAQRRALEALVESQRLLYNAALEERIGAYKRGVSRTYMDQCKALTEWRRSDQEAAAVPLNIQRATLRRLDHAYAGFFRRVKEKGIKAGFPRYRGKGWWDSFGFAEFVGVTLRRGRLLFKCMPGGLRIHLHRPMPLDSTIRSRTLKRDTKGWKVGFNIDIAIVESRKALRIVGVDLGVTRFAAMSDGGFIPSLRAARRAERRLRIAQRSLARKHVTSRGRQKARAHTARCHAAVARGRSNHLHQASSRLIRDYDVIAIEALSVKALARGMLARDVHDAGWTKFISMLRYKAERAGVQLIEVNPCGTSQECCGCGITVMKQLHERQHSCPSCGISIDRDLNAARNILNRAGVGPGLLNVAAGGKRAGGNLSPISGGVRMPPSPLN